MSTRSVNVKRLYVLSMLVLPMAILATLTVSYIVVRKTRAKKALKLLRPR